MKKYGIGFLEINGLTIYYILLNFKHTSENINLLDKHPLVKALVNCNKHGNIIESFNGTFTIRLTTTNCKEWNKFKEAVGLFRYDVELTRLNTKYSRFIELPVEQEVNLDYTY